MNYKFNFNYILPALLGFLLGCVTSCSPEIQEPIPTILDPVQNVQVELVGDTAVVSWGNPGDQSGLKASIKHYSGTSIVENASSFKYGVIQVGTDYSFTVKQLDQEGNYSLGETVYLFREGPQPVSDLKAIQVGSDIQLSWSLPSTGISALRLRVDAEEILLPADATTYTVSDPELREYRFELVGVDAEGLTSVTRYTRFTPGGMKIAYLGIAPDVESISDDDELASSAWFFENYPEGEYLSFDEIKEGKDLSQFGVIWWHYDGLLDDPSLPGKATDPAVVSAITEYHKNGGELLLNTHAVPYLYTIGRMKTPYSKMIGAGAGFSNDATWGINVNIGRMHDKSSHALFEGIVPQDVDGRKVIPLIGPGHREDHNNVFAGLQDYYGLSGTDEATYIAVTEADNVNILSTFEGINDYWMMGIYETLPTDQFKGTSIAIGIGAFEWNQNDRDNLYQEHIEQITKNALEYLSQL